MFLQVSVCPQGGGIPACLAGGIPACLAAGGCLLPGCACSWGCLFWGVTVLVGCLLWGVPDLGNVCSRGVPALGGGGGGDCPPPVDGYCCGRYASYWNAFLLPRGVACAAKPLASSSISLQLTHHPYQCQIHQQLKENLTNSLKLTSTMLKSSVYADLISINTMYSSNSTALSALWQFKDKVAVVRAVVASVVAVGKEIKLYKN